MTLVFGGGKAGLMGALADGALAAGGTVIGVIPEFLVLGPDCGLGPGLARPVLQAGALGDHRWKPFCNSRQCDGPEFHIASRAEAGFFLGVFVALEIFYDSLNVRIVLVHHCAT